MDLPDLGLSDPRQEIMSIVRQHHLKKDRGLAYNQLRTRLEREKNEQYRNRYTVMRPYYQTVIPISRDQNTSEPGETPYETMVNNAEEQGLSDDPESDEEMGGGDIFEVDDANRLRERLDAKIQELEDYMERLQELKSENRHLFFNIPSTRDYRVLDTSLGA